MADKYYPTRPKRTEATPRMAEAAAELGAPLLNLSTYYVFDGALDRACKEDDETNPGVAYGSSKLWGETPALLRQPAEYLRAIEQRQGQKI